MIISRHRGSRFWTVGCAVGALAFGLAAGFGLWCAGAPDDLCLSWWGGVEPDAIGCYGWLFLALSLLMLACLAFLLSCELELRDDGLSLRYGLWRRNCRLDELQDFSFLYTSHIRMYRIRLTGTRRTLYLTSLFNRFDEIENWLTERVKPL
ncbi:MAG: hypothetical protein JXR83_05270 [Deltaproteobacteria bacterium]|nr:hypothetical protein [Deltaproteobacteria bacterium]